MPGLMRGSGCGSPMPFRLLKGSTPAQMGSSMSTLSSMGGPERHLADTSLSVSDTTEVAISSCLFGLRACKWQKKL